MVVNKKSMRNTEIIRQLLQLQQMIIDKKLFDAEKQVKYLIDNI